MEITERQLKELCDIASAIDDENRVDDDMTGGYVDEPYKSIIDRIYAIVNECDSQKPDASENTLPIADVNESSSIQPVSMKLSNNEKQHLNRMQEINKEIDEALSTTMRIPPEWIG